MVNKFGKVKYQRGYHRGFGFLYEEESMQENQEEEEDMEDIPNPIGVWSWGGKVMRVDIWSDLLSNQ